MKLFYWSIAGLCGLGALVWAIASGQIVYRAQYIVSVDVTAPNEWEKVCGSFRSFEVFIPLYMQSKSLPMTECDRRDAMEATSLIEDLEAECPGGSCEQPAGPTDGRTMALLWEERQEFEATTGLEYGNSTVFFWDVWLQKTAPSD